MLFVGFQVVFAFACAGAWYWVLRRTPAQLLPTGSRALSALALGFLTTVLPYLAITTLRPHLMPYSQQTYPELTAKSIAVTVIFAAVVLMGGVLLRKRIQVVPAARPVKAWRFLVSVVLYALAGVLVGAAFFLSRWVVSTYGEIQPGQIVFFALGGDPGTVGEDSVTLIHQAVIPIILTTLCALTIPLVRRDLAFRRTPQRRISAQVLRRILAAVTVVTLAVSVVYAGVKVPLVGAIKSFAVRSKFIEENYVDPANAVLHYPDKPRNLIHIYMESMENSYYDRENGGYETENLMPQLAELTRENTSFSHTDKFGGPHQTMGANHSVAGMVNFQAGVPMIPHFSGSAGYISYPNFLTLGDMLHDQGYATEIMLGSNSNWHTMGDYYREHGDFFVFDNMEAKRRGLIPMDYSVWWGIEDDKLYEFAKDEMTRLGSSDQPFYFILENADTHPQGGYVSPLMKDKPFGQQYANVIHYSQAETVKLVRWIQQQPWYKDTVIVVTGDHKSMDKEFFQGWDPSYERTVVNIFINAVPTDPGEAVTHRRDFAPFDFFPTIVSALGITIDGNRLGLGVNLYSGEPTLIEQHGFDYVNGELGKRNVFYEKNRPNRLQ